MNFGFPDDLLAERILYSDIVPPCPVGLSPVLQIHSPRDPDCLSRIKGEFKRNNRSYAVILLDQGELDDQTLDELVTELNCGLYYIHYQTAEGKEVYYLFNDEQ